jgi:hypothetical protein
MPGECRGSGLCARRDREPADRGPGPALANPGIGYPAASVSHELPATRETARPAQRATAVAPHTASSPAPRAPRLGRRLLGAALLVAALGLGSCHAFWVALLA